MSTNDDIDDDYLNMNIAVSASSSKTSADSNESFSKILLPQ